MLFAVSCLIVFFLIKPIIQIIFIAGIIAYVFYPVYKAINKRLKNESASAILLILLIMLVLIGITALAIISLVSYKGVFYQLAHSALGEDLLGKLLQGVMSRPELNAYVQQWAKNATAQLVFDIFLSVPHFFFAFILMIFLLYYAFKDGKRFVEEVEKLMPMKGAHKKRIIKKVDDTLHATIYGTIVVAFIQALAATIGFLFFGVKLAAVWGMLTFLAAMIPFLGAAAVWSPIGAIMVISAYINNQSILPGVGVLLYGFFVISILDNILKPKLIGDRAEIHPVLVLLGIVGGALIFGFIGIFIGPIIAALFKTMVEIYKKEGLKWT